MIQDEKLLLLELLKLKVKYKKKTFEEVNKVLIDEKDDLLRDVLTSLAILDEKPSKTKKKTVDSSISCLDGIKNKNEEKYVLLKEIDALLRDKETFKLVKDLQVFISEKVKLNSRRNTKEQLIEVYLIKLSNFSDEELQCEIKSLKNIRSSKDISSFLNMAKEIVKSRKG